MKELPDIALIGSLIGDPARANILTALMSGHALTAGELAREAGVTLPTASSHLAKLRDAGLLSRASQGRHRYYRLAGAEVASALEALMALAVHKGLARTRPGPRDATLRKSRTCYDHLAGELAVDLYKTMGANGWLGVDGGEITVTAEGSDALAAIGIDVAAVASERRALCRECLDWSERRNHLGGALGAAIFGAVQVQGWATCGPGRRVVTFSQAGREALAAWLSGASEPTA